MSSSINEFFSKEEMITLLKDCVVQRDDDDGYGYIRIFALATHQLQKNLWFEMHIV